MTCTGGTRPASCWSILWCPTSALHYAPLIPKEDGSYCYGVGDDLPEQFGVCLVDGPPGNYGRLGAVHALADRIKNAVLILG